MKIFSFSSKILFAGILFFSCDKNDSNDIIADNQGSEINNYESTYAVIQGEIFDKNCISCHSSASVYNGMLALTSDTSYVSLINEYPYNTVAADDGLFRVSTASENDSTAHEGLYKSFLVEKIDAANIDHLYSDHPGYGGIMPPVDYLTNGEINFIKEWIKEGAPDTGHVVPLSVLDDIEIYDPEFEPLEIPENGLQIHLGPFEILPQQETEFFYYTALTNEEEKFINRVEIEMRTGSHHFILYTYPENFPIYLEEGEERYLRNTDGSYNESVLSIMPYQIFLTGTQTPQLDITFPDNVGLRLPANTYVDQNTHYLNYTDEAYIGEVYTNLHFMDNPPQYVAEILQLNVVDELYLPPMDTTTIEKIFMFEDILDVYNLDQASVNSIDVFQLFSHAHEKMITFEVFYIDENLDEKQIYFTDDWEHPPINCYGQSYYNQPGCSGGSDENIQILEGEGLRLSATYYNPTNQALEFGFLSTDEMMILFGYFYTK